MEILHLVINILITVIIYCIVPLILRLKNKYYSKEKAKKIALINSAIIIIIDIVICSINSSKPGYIAPFIFYGVNMFILTGDFQKTAMTKSKKVILGVFRLTIFVGLIIALLVSVQEINEYKEQVISQEYKIQSMDSRISELMETKNSNNKEIQFYDEFVVFVIEGYGDYYYTYDQMIEITQQEKQYFSIYSESNTYNGILTSKGSYTFRAYNISQAKGKGYKPIE